ncbi:MAG: right-handed parallel beta-helix repeat-containing protein [Breznakibacter sp.]|nr:right-handed parallel beta-helix repeat-containing protein [Breznakibacter sp.]
MRKYILAISLLISSYLSATTYTASNTNDSGAGSLREAIASATVAGDVVNITATGTITLASTLMVPNAITIQCTNASGIKISGNNLVRVFEISPETGTVYLKNLHILDALSTGGMGGGILFTTAVDAGLNMENCTISNCRTQGSEAKGGAIALLGNLNMKNCTLYNNYSEDGGSALDVYDEFSYVTIEHCTIFGNVTGGGALAINAGGLNLFTSPGVTIKNSIVAGNIYGTTTIKDFTTSPGCVFASQGYNLSTSNLPASLASDLQSKDLLTQVKVLALADYGGGIQTCALQSGSLAIDAASSAVLLDQRGNSRVGVADIGAYEAPLMPNPTTVAASLVATTSAQLNGTVDTKGASITSYEFQYGTSTNNYTTTVAASTSGTAPNITLTKSLTGLTLGQQYFFRVKVLSSGITYYSNELSFITKQSQTITFNSLPTNKKYGDADFALGATAPGGTVTYASSNTSIATIVGGNLHILKSGTVTITASQAGNSQYGEATPYMLNIILKRVLRVTVSMARPRLLNSQLQLQKLHYR